MRRWRSLPGSLRDAPAAIPALVAIALMIAGAASQAGYPLTRWAPGGLVALALVAIAVLAVPPRWALLPGAVKLAVGALAAYTALSFCSIAWAGVPADAWEGADRTLLYLLVFALFALWPARGAGAALLVCVWTLAMIGLAVYVALRLDTATGPAFRALFVDERLIYPAGYVNASAAQWGMAFWPALIVGRARPLPWALRGALAGGAVLLADLALFSLSRGAVLSMALVLALVLALVPGRLRTFATLVPVAGAVAATAPLVLRVGERIKGGHAPYGATHTAIAAIFVAGALAGAVVALGAAIEARPTLSPGFVRRVRRVLAVAAAACALGAIGAGLAAAGDPIARARSAWHSFRGGYSTNGSQPRLLSGLGSNRYDFYRVSLDELLAHPIGGIGADNFAQQYLAHGRSQETPRYPHSVELRTLAQTGTLGGVLAALGLAAALLAGWRAMRRCHDRLAAATAAGALGGFAYWALHGSFDWLWELAGLGAPAFALLGIACSLAPRVPRAAPGALTGPGLPRAAPGALTAPGLSGARRAAAAGGHASRRGRRTRVTLGLAAVLVALAAACSLAAPWLSERQLQSAARIWPRAPLAAYARLQHAASLDPLSDRPYLVAGTIALRFGDLARAQRQFSQALRRVPDGAYATLQLGAIASASGDRARALRLLGRAVRLTPRDPLSREALAVVHRGGRISVPALGRAILEAAQRFK